MPSGRGDCVQLRGTENIAASPVDGSIDTVIIVSVRMPVRPSPKSPPMSRMLRRSNPSHGDWFAVVELVVAGTVVIVDPVESVGGGVFAAVVVVVVSDDTNTEVSRSYCFRSTYPNQAWGRRMRRPRPRPAMSMVPAAADPDSPDRRFAMR